MSALQDGLKSYVMETSKHYKTHASSNDSLSIQPVETVVLWQAVNGLIKRSSLWACRLNDNCRFSCVPLVIVKGGMWFTAYKTFNSQEVL